MNDGVSLRNALDLFGEEEGKDREWLARKLGLTTKTISLMCHNKAWRGDRRKQVADLFLLSERQFTQLSVPPREYVRDGVKV